MNALLVSHPCETSGVQLRASLPFPLRKVGNVSAKIAQLIKNLQLKANKYDSQLEKFNTETTIDIPESLSNMFKDDIAV